MAGSGFPRPTWGRAGARRAGPSGDQEPSSKAGRKDRISTLLGPFSRSGEPVFEAPGALPPSGIALASHGVFRVKLIRLRRPLAGHPRSGAKRSGAGSEATLTRQRPDTLSRASAPLRALGCLTWSLPRSFILALRISFGVWIRSVSPSFACSLDGRITSHPVELVGARTIIPHARGRRARVGGDHPVKGTILLNGVFQPGKAAVTARPDPAKPSRSASLEWG